MRYGNEDTEFEFYSTIVRALAGILLFGRVGATGL